MWSSEEAAEAYAFKMSKLFAFMVATAIVMANDAAGNEVRVACMADYVDSSDACPIVDVVNVTASDTLIITNAEEFKHSNELGVKDSNWEVIPCSIFSTFPKLRRIEMSVNLQRLDGNAFANAQHLHTIQLTDNQIELVPTDAFAGAPNLRIITLSTNKIKYIEDGAFNGLAYLSYLHFTRNELRIIRNGTFSGASKLKQIDLAHNQIDTIEANAFRLPDLQYLDVRHNKLKSVTADVFNGAPILKTLILNNNEMWQINGLIEKLNLNKLSTFVVANNPVESINLALASNLPKLENLNVQNTTSAIYVEIVNATKSRSALEAIDLSNNNLTRSDILSVLAIFPHLSDLNLESNLFMKIDELSRIKEMFRDLFVLNIGCNRFECQWLANELQSINATLDVVNCPEPAITGAKNIKNVSCL